jgi:hypothetical protein
VQKGWQRDECVMGLLLLNIYKLAPTCTSKKITGLTNLISQTREFENWWFHIHNQLAQVAHEEALQLVVASTHLGE